MDKQINYIEDYVIGAAGMIGTNLVNHLKKKKREIYCTDIWLTNPKMDHNTDGIEYEDIRKLCAGNDFKDDIMVNNAWFLAALCTSYGMCKKPYTTFEITVKGLLKLAEHQKRISKILYTSSSEVYNQALGDESGITIPPMNKRKGYGWGKLSGEILLKTLQEETGTRYAIFRLFNVYGPYEWRDAVIPKFILQALTNRDITIYGNGKQSRTFTFVDDAINAMTKIARTEDNVTINIAGNETVEIGDLASLIVDIIGSASKIKTGIVPDLDDDIFTRKCNNSRMKQFYSPKYTLREGLLKTILYYEGVIKKMKYENSLKLIDCEANDQVINENFLNTGCQHGQ